MKAAIVKTNSIIEIKNLEKSPLGPREILVKMQACGICGSDVEKVFGKYGQPSMRLGHEPAGIITQVGSEISDFNIGDRVFTHHHVACYSANCHECSHGNETMCEKYYKSNLEPCGLADEYVVPKWNIDNGGMLKLPDSMSFDEAVGPTGIMHVMLAVYYEFKKVFCLDLNDFRLAYAKKFDTVTIRADDPSALEIIKSQTENKGVDVVIVATGNMKALLDAINFVRKGGTIIVFGVPSKGDKIELDMSKIYSKNITIVNTYAASDIDTKEALEMISTKKINVKQLITHKYTLSDVQKAFEHAKTGKDAMKIIINN